MSSITMHSVTSNASDVAEFDFSQSSESPLEATPKKGKGRVGKAIAFSDEAIFGRAFGRSTKADDVCAMSALMEKGLLDIDGKLTLMESGDALDEGEVKKLFWQYLRYLWTNNVESNLFFKRWVKEGKQGVLVAKQVAQTVFEALGGVGEVSREEAGAWRVQDIAIGVNRIVEAQNPRIPFVTNTMHMVLKKLKYDAEQFPYMEELMQHLKSQIDVYKAKNETLGAVGIYEKGPDGVVKIVNGPEDSSVQIVL